MLFHPPFWPLLFRITRHFLLLYASGFRICRGFWTFMHLSTAFSWHPSAALTWFRCAGFVLLFIPPSPGFTEDCGTHFRSTFPGSCSLAGWSPTDKSSSALRLHSLWNRAEVHECSSHLVVASISFCRG